MNLGVKISKSYHKTLRMVESRDNMAISSILVDVDNSVQIRLLMCFAYGMVVNEIFKHILLIGR